MDKPKCWVKNAIKNLKLNFGPKFGENTDKPKCWVKNAIKNLQLKMKVEVGLKFKI